VVFRDATGKVVGGDVTSSDTPIIFRDEQGNDLGGEKQRPPRRFSHPRAVEPANSRS
jgi:hypothetical protein